MNHFTCLCVYDIKHTPHHFRTVPYVKHEYFGAILRSSEMLRNYFRSSLPIIRDSLPVISSRVRHSSRTERPDWVTLNLGKQVRI